MFVYAVNIFSYIMPSAILDRQVVLPEQNFPRTQALRIKCGNRDDDGSVMGGSTTFLSCWTMYPRISLLVTGNFTSTASSGHPHSPTIF